MPVLQSFEAASLSQQDLPSADLHILRRNFEKKHWSSNYSLRNRATTAIFLDFPSFSVNKVTTNPILCSLRDREGTRSCNKEMESTGMSTSIPEVLLLSIFINGHHIIVSLFSDSYFYLAAISGGRRKFFRGGGLRPKWAEPRKNLPWNFFKKF